MSADTINFLTAKLKIKKKPDFQDAYHRQSSWKFQNKDNHKNRYYNEW